MKSEERLFACDVANEKLTIPSEKGDSYSLASYFNSSLGIVFFVVHVFFIWPIKLLKMR